MVGGCRGEVFDRASSFPMAIYPVEYIEDNSTLAVSSQLSHFNVHGKIFIDTKFNPGFLQIGCRLRPRFTPVRTAEIAKIRRLHDTMTVELARPEDPSTNAR
jgi:hypothetical protein